jgi:hypothetical protein
VPFEDSWGHHLQQLLGHEVQVLNFGVDGYGIDQMYLRYQRDVRPWKPEVVGIGFDGHDFRRTMAVYPFVSFHWPGYLVKPRFVVEQGDLKLLNLPLPAPDEILSAAEVHQLPFIEYDLGYGTVDWRWRFERGPLLLRFLTSLSPRRPVTDPRVSDEATQVVNSRLLGELAKSIEDSGAVPFLVLFTESGHPLAEATLARARLPFMAASECVADVPADRRRVPSGHHYTGPANRAIARCTAEVVEVGLRRARALARADRSRAPAAGPRSAGGPARSEAVDALRGLR